MADVFGNIFVASKLEDAVKSILQAWFPTYLKEIEYQLSMPVGVLPAPRDYTARTDIDGLPGEIMPRCTVISPGIMGRPIKDGNGVYRATWGLGVGVAVAHADENLARLHSHIYGAAARAILVQPRNGLGLGGAVNSIEWLDENYDKLPIADLVQQYWAAAEYFAIEIHDLVTKHRGPTAPDIVPGTPYGIVGDGKIIIDLQKEDISG